MRDRQPVRARARSGTVRVDANTFFGVMVTNVCWFSALATISWFLGLYLFRAMHQQTALFAADHRFQTSDLLILAAQLQLAAALLVALTPRVPAGYKAAVGCGVFMLLGFWWWSGLRMLGGAGISLPRHRWLFLGVALPAGYLAGLWIAGMVITVPASLLLLIGSIGEMEPWGALAALLLITLSVTAVVVAVFCQRFCEQIVQRARTDRATRDGIEFVGARLWPPPWSIPARIRSPGTPPAPNEIDWLDGSVARQPITASVVGASAAEGRQGDPISPAIGEPESGVRDAGDALPNENLATNTLHE